MPTDNSSLAGALSGVDEEEQFDSPADPNAQHIMDPYYRNHRDYSTMPAPHAQYSLATHFLPVECAPYPRQSSKRRRLDTPPPPPEGSANSSFGHSQYTNPRPSFKHTSPNTTSNPYPQYEATSHGARAHPAPSVADLPQATQNSNAYTTTPASSSAKFDRSQAAPDVGGHHLPCTCVQCANNPIVSEMHSVVLELDTIPGDIPIPILYMICGRLLASIEGHYYMNKYTLALNNMFRICYAHCVEKLIKAEAMAGNFNVNPRMPPPFVPTTYPFSASPSPPERNWTPASSHSSFSTFSSTSDLTHFTASSAVDVSMPTTSTPSSSSSPHSYQIPATNLNDFNASIPESGINKGKGKATLTSPASKGSPTSFVVSSCGVGRATSSSFKGVP